jgi:Arc/MetJ family transcription regulator
VAIVPIVITGDISAAVILGFHPPGAPVTMTVCAQDREVQVSVVNSAAREVPVQGSASYCSRAMLMTYTRGIHHQQRGALMALTQIDIDEDALAEAMRLSGAKTKKETVNVALREFSARHRRIAALEHYAALAAGWDFEGWEHRRAAEKDPAA